nr:hypothetical protein [Streptomyces sp. Ru73]
MAGTAPGTMADAVAAAGPQVCDDMTVEVALSVMAAARTGQLLVCDADDRGTGLVTRAQLTAVHEDTATACPDRVRLRDLLDTRVPH